MEASHEILDNGLSVYAKEFPGLETVGISLGVNTGSVDEKPRINGSSHFLEHMLFKGTASRTWKQIDDQLKELGAYHNAFTDHESTVYIIQVYKGYFQKAMEILSDMIINSTIPEKEFNLERGPIINENLIHHDNPRYLISDFIPKALYRKNPARMSVGGDNDTTIMNVRRNDLLGIYKRYYTPRNCVLAIYGGIKKESAFSSAEKFFGAMSGKYHEPRRTPAREAQRHKVLSISRKGIKQTRVGVGFMCREFNERSVDEFLGLSVIERYLDDKLFEEVREKRGLSYDPMASYNPYGSFGFIAAAAGVEPKNLGKAHEVMMEEFRKLQDGEIDKAEFERTKKALYVEGKIKKEGSLEMSVSMVTFALMYGGPGLLERMPELIKGVGIDDARKYCSKYINIDKSGEVLLKPA